MIELSIVSVIHKPEQIPDCLNSISSVYNTVNAPFETILVANKSSDFSTEIFNKKFHDLKIIENKENRGYGTACNQGVSIAKGKRILILNPDIILKENTINELLKYLDDNNDAKIVACKLNNPDGTTQDSHREFPTITSLIGRQFSTLFRRKKIIAQDVSQPTKVDWVSGAFMLMRNKYYFDEKFFLYFEDVDLCKRIGGVYYYPLVSATHLTQRESSKNLKFITIHLKSMIHYFAKH